jgi:hypothetical protein
LKILMLLNGRISVPEEKAPEPVKVDFDPEKYVSEATSHIDDFTEEGYAASGAEVADSLIPDESPVYTVEVLMPEDSIGERNFPDEAYAGRSIEDNARMQGVPAEPEEVVDRLEDGYVYLMAVAHASDPEMDPEFRVAEMPIDAELVNRSENLDAMERVHGVVEDLDYDLAFYDYTLWTSGHSEPEGAMQEARDTELKFAASLYTETPFHVDVGYLSSPQEDGSEFGVEIRNRASEAVRDSSVEDARGAVTEIVRKLESEGFDFQDEILEMEI